MAGHGSRFLPATKAMPKELLPIVDKPLIQYAAEEAISAGADTLIFVTGRNKRAIEDHFDSNQELEAALRLKGKNDKADMVRNILPVGVECIFVRQAEQLGLGHAILCAERAVGDEPFMVILADDFLANDGKDLSAELIQSFDNSGKMQIAAMEIEGPEIANYGVIVEGESKGIVKGLIEKPKYEDAPSNLASIGRYLLTPEIFETIRKISKGAGGEIQLADALNHQAEKENVESINFGGKRFDCGSVDGFLEAILHFSKER